ncbi:MAG TPA: hypothetical protein VF142_10730, partial [Longimicrobium sp.]
ALPLIAILLAWAGVGADRARPWIHAAGAAWVAACAAVAWQTAQGRAPLELSAANAAAATALAAWAVVAVLAFRTWMRGGVQASAVVRTAAA